MRLLWPLGAGAVFLLVAIACSSSAGQPEGTEPVVQAEPEREYQRPDELPLIKGPVSVDGLRAILGTADLGVGTNRFGFVVTSQSGLVTAPTARVQSYFVGEDAIRETTGAVFQPWPYGSRGLYTTDLTFDRPGQWSIEVTVDRPDGTPGRARLQFDVERMPLAPAVGSPAVSSVNRTVDDVEDLSELTTGSLQDPDLYQTTIFDASQSGLPTVIVFASPAFCINAVCGPQVEVLQELKNSYLGKANFIHVDIYDNPHEIQGDLDRARISPIAVEWSLPSIEWTFVLDREGVVSARFEAFATLTEVEEALQKVL